MTKPTNLQEKPFSGRDENGLISLQEAVEAELEKIFESGGIKKYNGQYWDGNDEYTCDDLVKQIKSSLLRIANKAEKKERERIMFIYSLKADWFIGKGIREEYLEACKKEILTNSNETK